MQMQMEIHNLKIIIKPFIEVSFIVMTFMRAELFSIQFSFW